MDEYWEIKNEIVHAPAVSNTFAIEFDPVSHGLDVDFRLTKFSPQQECNIPQDTRNKLLGGLSQNQNSVGTSVASQVLPGIEHVIQTGAPQLDIGLDCSVTPLRYQGLSLVQTTEFSYPVCNDPYTMGRIACVKVLSNLYAMGVSKCDNIHILLGVSSAMTEREREAVIPLIMKGFQDCAIEAETTVTGGQTVVNPWLIIGGVATTVCAQHEIRMPSNAEVGDSLILTKPLGTDIAVTAYQLRDQPLQWNAIKLVASEETIKKAYRRAIDTMSSLNRTAAQLMQSHCARGATDIAGYGLLGHANDLVRVQKNAVTFLINNLPVIANTPAIEQCIRGLVYRKLRDGRSVETSGGLLICLPREKAQSFCRLFKEIEGRMCWVIGTVEKGDRTAQILMPRLLAAPERERDELW